MVPKFRAWWTENKIMTDVYILMFSQGGIHVTDGCWQESFVGRKCILMQSTGLKDKNGVEIYEGDIVSYTSSIMAKNEWHKKITRYGSALVMASFDDKTRDSAELLNLLSIHKGIEVLGNIYQNPELLGSDDS